MSSRTDTALRYNQQHLQKLHVFRQDLQPKPSHDWNHYSSLRRPGEVLNKTNKNFFESDLPMQNDMNIQYIAAPLSWQAPDLSSATLSEHTLVLAAQSGDASAFVDLCKLHSDKILRRLYRITQNWEDAEDALQDSFMKAFLNIHKFEGRSSFSSWLTRIAINSALMLLRKRRSRNEIPMEVSVDGEQYPQQREILDPAESPELSYVQCERREKLGRAIPRLRPCFRSVVELYHIEDRSAAEIADELNISISAVKSRLLRAKTALRRSIATTRRPIAAPQSIPA